MSWPRGMHDDVTIRHVQSQSKQEFTMYLDMYKNSRPVMRPCVFLVVCLDFLFRCLFDVYI